MLTTVCPLKPFALPRTQSELPPKTVFGELMNRRARKGLGTALGRSIGCAGLPHDRRDVPRPGSDHSRGPPAPARRDANLGSLGWVAGLQRTRAKVRLLSLLAPSCALHAQRARQAQCFRSPRRRGSGSPGARLVQPRGRPEDFMANATVQQEIRDFLTAERIAIVGLSHNPQDFSCAILEKLEGAGFDVYGVNPRLDEDPTKRRFKDLRSIPGEPVDGVFLTTPPSAAIAIVHECAKLGIKRVWMHQSFGQGSTSKDAVEFCRANGIHVIDRGCPMMFVEPVDFFHKTMRWCKGLKAIA